MSVSEAYLFCSTLSRSCIPCLTFLQKHNLPVQLVRLDTPLAKDAVMRSKTYKITGVPTLMIVYDDQTINFIAGQPKVMQWFQQAITSGDTVMSEQTKLAFSDDDSDDEKPRRKKKNKKKATAKSSGMYDTAHSNAIPSVVAQSTAVSDETEDIEFFGEEEASPSVPVSSSKSKGVKESSMAAIKEHAKRMQAEAEQTLGFKQN